ncbi:MAG: hypothetical protein N3B21_06640 [Clostridia bacterium]|nr:hypothetical protein [Clostridia bacterium]
MIRKISAIILCALFAASCSNSSSTKPGKSDTSAVMQIETKSLSTSRDDIHEGTPLQIQFSGEEFYTATPELISAIVSNIVSKSEEINPEVYETSEMRQKYKELVSNYKFDEYDIKFRFSKHRDILFSRKENVFHFEGENRLYKVYGDNSRLLMRLVFDNGNNTIKYMGESKMVLGLHEGDIDGDSILEKVSLEQGSGLSLKVDDKEFVIAKEINWQISPYRTVIEPPTLRIVLPKNSRHFKIVVTIVWATNKIGSTVEMWVFDYRKKQIVKMLEVPADTHELDITTKYMGDHTVKVEIPQFKEVSLVKFNKEEFIFPEMKLKNETKWLKELFDGKNKVFASSHTSYGVKDLDEDGYDELVTCRGVYTGLMNLGLCRMYTVYRIAPKEIIPIKVIIEGNVNDRLLQNDIMDTIMHNGKIKLSGGKINDNRLIYRFQEDVINALDAMVRDKQLIKGIDGYYINLNGE